MYKKKPVSDIVCHRCRYKFRQKRADQKFCSRNCKTKVKNDPYIVYRKDHCDFCGFVPLHLCQSDVDHIDGDKSNNNHSNLQTLCANYHRLKTFLNKDWKKRSQN